MTERSYEDDPTIGHDAELWRRIPPWHFYRDPNDGSTRPSSAAFEDDSDHDPMSIVLGEECAGPASVLAGHDSYALAAFTARLAREKGQKLVRDPLPDEPAHGLVVGTKTTSTRRAFAKHSRWVVEPP